VRRFLALLRRLRPASPDVTPAHEKADVRRRLADARRTTEDVERRVRALRDERHAIDGGEG